MRGRGSVYSSDSDEAELREDGAEHEGVVGGCVWWPQVSRPQGGQRLPHREKAAVDLCGGAYRPTLCSIIIVERRTKSGCSAAGNSFSVALAFFSYRSVLRTLNLLFNQGDIYLHIYVPLI